MANPNRSESSVPPSPQSSAFVLPPKLAALLADYSAHHKTFGNKVTHYIGIPMIMMTLLGMLGQLVIGDGFTGSEVLRADGGMVLWVFAMAWYLSLDWRLAVPFGFVALGFYFAGRHLSLEVQVGGFVLGWILQFIGHGVYEKQRPAFLDNLRHLLIGPMWIFARLVGVLKK
jgi:uncharacterized membrane protein YGL010W